MSSVFFHERQHSIPGNVSQGWLNVFRFSFQANLLTLINDHGYFAEEKGADMSSGGSRLDWNKLTVSCREKLWQNISVSLQNFFLRLLSEESSYGSFSPGRGKWAKSVWIFLFLKLHCDQTVWFFKVFSTVLKRLCPLQSKNTFVYPSKNFWSPVRHPCFCPIERFLGKD